MCDDFEEKLIKFGNPGKMLKIRVVRSIVTESEFWDK